MIFFLLKIKPKQVIFRTFINMFLLLALSRYAFAPVEVIMEKGVICDFMLICWWNGVIEHGNRRSKACKFGPKPQFFPLLFVAMCIRTGETKESVFIALLYASLHAPTKSPTKCVDLNENNEHT